LITCKQLNRYTANAKAIRAIKRCIADMLGTDAGIGSDVILDYRKGYPRPQTVVGFDYKRYEQKLADLERLRVKQEEVEQWIEAIEDPMTRMVFEEYYLMGRSWEEIARHCGYSNPNYPRLKIRDVYLKQMGIK